MDAGQTIERNDPDCSRPGSPKKGGWVLARRSSGMIQTAADPVPQTMMVQGVITSLPDHRTQSARTIADLSA